MLQSDNEIINLDRNFNVELFKIYKQVKYIVDNSNEINNDIAQDLLKLAENFYQKFKNSVIPITPPDPMREPYTSAQIQFKNGCVMIPYMFYINYKDNPSIELEKIFSKNHTWKNLLSDLLINFHKYRKTLNDTDIIIIKFLAQYSGGTTNLTYPLTLGLIVNRTRIKKSRESISKHFINLINRMIVYNFTMFNPWKMGWDLKLVTYDRGDDYLYEEDEYINKFTVAKELLFSNKAFRIVQEPLVKEQESAINLFNESFHINSLSYNWNLNQLKVKPEDSFQIIPAFGEARPSTIIPTIDLNIKDGISNWIEDKELSSPSRKNILFKVIKYLIQYDIPLLTYEKTSENIGISTEQLNFAMRFLFKHKIINCAVKYMYIGCTPIFNFLITKITHEQQEWIAQNLYLLPFSYIWRGDNVLAGVCNVPNHWVPDLLSFFSYLMSQDMDVYIGQSILFESWYRNNILLPLDEFKLSEFGSENLYYESKEPENLQI